MATFSQTEAEACVVKRCESVLSNSTHQYYVFAVNDDNGEYYEWSNQTLGASASHIDIKNSIVSHLQTEEKRNPSPIITHVSDSGVIGATVSSLPLS